MTKISEAKFREILKCFSEDCTASITAALTGVSRPSINRIFTMLRHRIVEMSIKQARELGEFEVDESYFGAKRVRGKRGRGAAGKTPVFGLLKRNGSVYVNIVKNCSREQLLPIIQGKVLEGSTIYSDGWRAYDGLLLNGYDHYRVFHSENEFARGKSHVNGIEAFWSFAKRRLNKFNGLAEETFMLHLKECEWRWNHREENVYVILLTLLRKNPL
jgi:transposase-like protein